MTTQGGIHVRERSNECLGASVGTGAKHEQCNGYYARKGHGLTWGKPCPCECHEVRR